jgi:2-oxoglutarate ferredoxin oxidoreductase subunit gamma
VSFGKKERKETKIRFCGLGGMGVILISIILGKAAIYDKKNAIQTQSYGPEQRGSKVKSDVIISKDDSISYPTEGKVDVLVGFSQDAFNYYSQKVKEDGLILINSDLIKIKTDSKRIFKIPGSTIAKELNNEKILNMVMLGSFCKLTNLVSNDSIYKSITDTVYSRFIKLNISAFNKGYESISIE